MSCSLVNGIWCSIFKMQFKISFELKSLVYGVLGRSFIKHSLYLLIVFSEHNFTSLHSTWCWLVFLLLVSLSTLGQPSGGSCVLYVFFRFFFFPEKVKHWIEILMRGWSNLVVNLKKTWDDFFFHFHHSNKIYGISTATEKKTDWSVCILHCMFRITKRNKRYFWWWKYVYSIIDSKSFERDDKLDERLCKISIFEENP